MGNVGARVFTPEDLLERVRKAEAATAARKRKGKEKEV